jgi:hypothetical protein
MDPSQTVFLSQCSRELMILESSRPMSFYPIRSSFLMGMVALFDLLFLKYINDIKYHWWRCIGTPYGTNKWQVGDLLQQNGAFNMEMSKGKKARLADKVVKHGFPFKLTKEDNNWLLCCAWPKSFGRAETNQDVIVECGWGTLNYVLRDDLELQESQERIKQ